MISARYLRVAVPSPLHRAFDYLPPAGVPIEHIHPGARVRVPFGRQILTGVVMETRTHTEAPADKLRRATELLDPKPLVGEELLYLARWAMDYYRAPPGAVFETLFPVRLRRGDDAGAGAGECWRLSDTGKVHDIDALSRAPRQARLLARLQRSGETMTAAELAEDGAGWRAGIKALEEKGLVVRETVTPVLPPLPPLPAPEPGAAQADAITAVSRALGSFQAFLLEGVTGSGKTEVYLRILDAVLAAGQQAVVLVPEIGLTPQLVDGFRRRLNAPLAVSHSGLNDTERLAAWTAMAQGEARVLIGTRSAVFVPLAEPGLFIVDEEHDSSFKQQEGFRYSARDLAVVRAQRNSVPVLLGSATPSLESLANARSRRYRHLQLPERAGDALPPAVSLIDIRGRRLTGGLSDNLLQAIRRHLAADGQVLLFLNRRGYAPRLICNDCGWLAKCRRCDACLTFHQRREKLQCHHCGAEAALPPACPDCGHATLEHMGRGTERLEETLAGLFPDERVARVDRDTTSRKGSLDTLLKEIRSGHRRLLIGTQMLAKGHDFPNLTLVGVMNADSGLFGLDFRSGERMAQLIVQVAGRAGRAERPGEVLIQTHHPEHPLLVQLARHGYDAFADAALREREAAELPPYASLALLRAEAADSAAPRAFLEAARNLADALQKDRGAVSVLGPAPAPMERRAGRYRAQLLLRAAGRAQLQGLLADWVPQLEHLPEARKVRWSVDVDPADLF
ncbi:MAG TPA: primosomal protein N' [Gammaproteobacteria bacterium]